MTTATLKKEIQKVIESIDDNHLLEAVFTLLSNNVKQNSYDLTEQEIKIIEERKAIYKEGKSKTYSVNAVKKKILKNLGK